MLLLDKDYWMGYFLIKFYSKATYMTRVSGVYSDLIYQFLKPILCMWDFLNIEHLP